MTSSHTYGQGTGTSVNSRYCCELPSTSQVDPDSSDERSASHNRPCPQCEHERRQSLNTCCTLSFGFSCILHIFKLDHSRPEQHSFEIADPCRDLSPRRRHHSLDKQRAPMSQKQARQDSARHSMSNSQNLKSPSAVGKNQGLQNLQCDSTAADQFQWSDIIMIDWRSDDPDIASSSNGIFMPFERSPEQASDSMACITTLPAARGNSLTTTLDEASPQGFSLNSTTTSDHTFSKHSGSEQSSEPIRKVTDDGNEIYRIDKRSGPPQRIAMSYAQACSNPSSSIQKSPAVEQATRGSAGVAKDCFSDSGSTATAIGDNGNHDQRSCLPAYGNPNKTFMELYGSLSQVNRDHVQENKLSIADKSPRVLSDSTSSLEHIKFYHRHQPYYEFTNFSEIPLFFEGKYFRTAEHVFQAQKFTNPYAQDDIRRCHTPRDALNCARGYRTLVRPDWHSINIELMENILYQKFTQWRYLWEQLISTKDNKLVEDAGHRDNFWGAGINGQGRNELGKALMRVRARLLKMPAPKYCHDDFDNSATDKNCMPKNVVSKTELI